MERRPASPPPPGPASRLSYENTLASEVARAERRGADEVRRQLRALLEDRRRVVRQGEVQVEVVEVSAVEQLLDLSDDD